MVTGAGLRVSTIFGPTYRPLDADRSLGTWDEDQRRTVETIELAASIGAASVYVCTGAASTLELGRGGRRVLPSWWRRRWPAAPSWACRCCWSRRTRSASTSASSSGSATPWTSPAGPAPRSCSTSSRAGTSGASRTSSATTSTWWALTQISDYVIGTTRTGDRAVPGDGDVPLERLLAMVLDAGFEGSFDLEVMGPRVEEEGYPSAVRRSIERASELLDRLGA